jgi:hypothetical protein
VRRLSLLEAFIKEEIGRNFHTVDPTPNTWEDFQDYQIECFPTETGAYTVDVSFEGKKLTQTARFQNETEAKHFARMVVDKHRVTAMNNCE